MHEHVEIIMPPTSDVDAAVAQILKPFNENDEENTKAFWDWYEIGGRWAGAKTRAALSPASLSDFEQWMVDEKIKLNSLQFGKQTLAGEDMREKVDAKWREMFPGAGPHCVLFDHSSPRGSALQGDVCRLSEVPERLTAARAIIAAPSYNNDCLEPVRMEQRHVWNGVSHLETIWDGSVLGAIERWQKKPARPIERARPCADWMVVTVDVHC